MSLPRQNADRGDLQGLGLEPCNANPRQEPKIQETGRLSKRSTIESYPCSTGSNPPSEILSGAGRFQPAQNRAGSSLGWGFATFRTKSGGTPSEILRVTLNVTLGRSLGGVNTGYAPVVTVLAFLKKSVDDNDGKIVGVLWGFCGGY